MTHVTVYLPPQLHKDLRHYCVDNETGMTKLIHNHLVNLLEFRWELRQDNVGLHTDSSQLDASAASDLEQQTGWSSLHTLIDLSTPER